MSACFAYGLAAGDPIKALTLRGGTPPLWQGLPVLVVVLLGGFTTNFIWTLYLNIRNRSGHEYLASELPVRFSDPGGPQPIEETALTGPTASVLTHASTAVMRETGERAAAQELFAVRVGRRDVVHAVFLLQHGRNEDGRLHIFELDAAHGEHRDFQHVVGSRVERVEGRGADRDPVARSWFERAARLDTHCGLRELSGGSAAALRDPVVAGHLCLDGSS